jgi:SET domain
MGSIDWNAERNKLTAHLYENPYDLVLYIERATAYEHLGYPDLAAGDAYRALLLIDEVSDEDFEYHQQTLSALALRNGVENDENCLEDPLISACLLKSSKQCFSLLTLNLFKCNCFKSSLDFCNRGLVAFPNDSEFLAQRERIVNAAKKALGSTATDEKLNVASFPEHGQAKRELYPWNDKEPDRFSKESIEFLNSEMQKVAPKCEVLMTELPTLTIAQIAELRKQNLSIPTNKQLGMFAKEDIAPSEIVLQERTLLTVNNRLHESLCDACSTVLPDLKTASLTGQQIQSCPDCTDVIFCDYTCLDLALETYHPAVCGKDVDAIGKDTDPRQAADALYLLLLQRSFALAETQELHPLDLKEVKYIWGDFTNSATPGSVEAPSAVQWNIDASLPFSFENNIASPLHVLEKMDINIFERLADFDTWVINTLYAKFRGTASARLSTLDGRPEVSAVHPNWCLANHSCNPNVVWEWGGEISFEARKERADTGPGGPRAREERVDGLRGGIKKGEEILNHYCDVDLGYKDRRDWAKGSLGGPCMCDRCLQEEAADV